MTAAQIERARHMQAGGRSYVNIGIAIGCTVAEIKDELVPGWREQGCRFGRHATKGDDNAELR